MLGNIALGLAFLGQGRLHCRRGRLGRVNVVGLAADEFWMLFIPMVTGTVVGSWVSTQLAVRVGTTGSIRIGFFVMIAASLASTALIVFSVKAAMPWP